MTERHRPQLAPHVAWTFSFLIAVKTHLQKRKISPLSLTGKHLSSNNRDVADVATLEDE
jgi:hypothetical protein